MSRRNECCYQLGSLRIVYFCCLHVRLLRVTVNINQSINQENWSYGIPALSSVLSATNIANVCHIENAMIGYFTLGQLPTFYSQPYTAQTLVPDNNSSIATMGGRQKKGSGVSEGRGGHRSYVRISSRYIKTI